MMVVSKKNLKPDDDSSTCTETTTTTAESHPSPKASRRFNLVRHRLRFSEFNEVIPAIYTLEEDEVNKCWYNGRDYITMQNQSRQIVLKMNRGENVEEPNVTTGRGLEKYTRQGRLRSKRRKIIISTCVCIGDFWILANFYQQSASAYKDDAHSFGLKDQLAVQSELEKMRQRFGKSPQRQQLQSMTGQSFAESPHQN
jgi:hypothetical protein